MATILIKQVHSVSLLTRQIDEGRRQSVMEDLQSKKKVVCLNSKIDFIQPFKTHLQVVKGNVNVAPGKKMAQIREDRRPNETDRRQEDKRQKETQEDKTDKRQKRKAENDEDTVDSEMKKRRISKLNDTKDFSAHIQRASTPIPSATNSMKRKRDEPEMSLANLSTVHELEIS